MKKLKSKDWEIKHSSLALSLKKQVSYDECRNYACNDIANTTHIDENLPFIYEIPKGTPYNFLVRIDTCEVGYNKEEYYNSFKKRDFISFSTYYNKNKSHYNYKDRNVLFAYNVKPDTIVHIFPTDSAIITTAKNEEELTDIPSLWLNQNELNKITLKLKTYNQVTCKTKQDGDILKPIAIIFEDKINDYGLSIAKEFGIKCIIVHPDNDVIDNSSNLFADFSKTQIIAKKIKEMYGFDISHHYNCN